MAEGKIINEESHLNFTALNTFRNELEEGEGLFITLNDKE
jgi:hypothetical protein